MPCSSPIGVACQPGGWCIEEELTTEKHTSFGDDVLNVDRRLFCLCGNITAGGDDDEGIRLAVRVLDVETAEEDGRGGDHSLSQMEFLAELGYYWDGVGTINDDTGARGWTGEIGSRLAKNMLRKPRYSGLSTYWRSSERAW